uniref:E4 protein n=1 Tax=Human papillomavirus TaxID=10566 RepID=A0A385PMX3_9PAPI|nr:MAG: E4 protein [Human papillomavirus]
MWKDLVPQDNGQCTLKMKLFLLLIAHKDHLPPSLFKDLSVPPGTPFPQRKPTADGTKAKREALAQPPRRPRYDADDDEETNKENRPPDYDRKGYGRLAVASLLQKLEEELLQYQEEVLQELSALRERLGIPQ